MIAGYCVERATEKEAKPKTAEPRRSDPSTIPWTQSRGSVYTVGRFCETGRFHTQEVKQRGVLDGDSGEPTKMIWSAKISHRHLKLRWQADRQTGRQTDMQQQ